MANGNPPESLRVILSHDLKYWKSVADAILIWSLSIAGFAAVVVCVSTWLSMTLGDEITEFNERSLRRIQSETEGKVATASALGVSAGEEAGNAKVIAARANARAEELRYENLLLQERLQSEADARGAMLKQLAPRDFSAEQMNSFVETIRGRGVNSISVFTIPDAESMSFEFTVMEGLKRAGVEVKWYRLNSNIILLDGISSTGITLYESPRMKQILPIFEAFVKVNVSAMANTPPTPLPNVPNPSLFIALRETPFFTMPKWQFPEFNREHPPAWDPRPK